MKDLYRQLDKEITFFIDHMSDQTQGMHAVDQMLKTAKKIGGQMFTDVERLAKDYREKKKAVAQDALRIKHEVREL